MIQEGKGKVAEMTPLSRREHIDARAGLRNTDEGGKVCWSQGACRGFSPIDLYLLTDKTLMLGNIEGRRRRG